MKSTITDILLVIAISVGVGVFLYFTISSSYDKDQVTEVNDVHVLQVSQEPVKNGLQDAGTWDDLVKAKVITLHD